MSLRRAARVFVCLAFASFVFPSAARAEEEAPADHAPPLVIKVYQVADLIVPLASTDGTKTKPDFDWLMDLIELRTGADCWTHSGGQGSINDHESTLSIVVRQTHATHERIADLLDEIRGTGDLALCVEIQLVRGNLETCGNTKPHRTAQGLVDSAGKQRLLQTLESQADGKILLAPKLTFFNGTTASIETAEEGCTKTFNIRGVISKDNRYSRLWVDAKIDGQTTKAELLIPEGHTAVRKLPGDNSWLLLTSHVINAEEPQVISPLKSEPWTPVEQKKRYLVPVDESPEPTELTAVPQFKAQAESFGLAVRRAKGAVEAGAEKGEASSEAQPELATAVAHTEYRVAQAEPRDATTFSADPPPPPKAVSSFEMYPRQSPQPKQPRVLHGFVTGSEGGKPKKDEAPYRLWIGDMLQNAGVAHVFPNPNVVHGFEIAPANDPPARLDVCLDETDCQPAPKSPIQFGQVFDRIFVTPLPAFPMPWNELGAPRSLTVDAGKSQPRFTISHIEMGRRAILTRTKSPEVSGFIIETAPLEVPKLQFTQNDVVIIPEAGPVRVQQASGIEESVAALDGHLKAAESLLDKLGLDAEEHAVHSIRQTIRRRAEERCKEIDQEISRLKVARERLEKLAKPETAGEADGVSEVR